MELENEAFYWAIAYDELTVVQYSEHGGDVFWMIGDDGSGGVNNDNIKIIAKIEPPDLADDPDPDYDDQGNLKPGVDHR